MFVWNFQIGSRGDQRRSCEHSLNFIGINKVEVRIDKMILKNFKKPSYDCRPNF